MQKVIFFDFYGVLDNGKQENGHTMDIIRKTADFNKLLRLFTFVLEQDAMFISISTHNHETDTMTLCYDTFLKYHTNELTESELKRLDELFEKSCWYSYSYSKNEMIFEFIYNYCEDNNISRMDLDIVSFEDQEKLDPMANQIWVKSTLGLTDENINSARNIFSNSLQYKQQSYKQQEGRIKRNKK